MFDEKTIELCLKDEEGYVLELKYDGSKTTKNKYDYLNYAQQEEF